MSDNPDPLLVLQGVGWLTRKAIGLATVRVRVSLLTSSRQHIDTNPSQLTVNEYTDSDGTTHIDITSNASGLSTTQENRTLDFQDRSHQDRIFGNVVGRSRLIVLSQPFVPCAKYSESEIGFLLAKTLRDGETSSKFLEDDSVQSFAKNQDSGYGWTAEQVWGFELIDGNRYYTRRVVGKDASGQKSELVRLVYDYQGPVDPPEKDDDDAGLLYDEE